MKKTQIFFDGIKSHIYENKTLSNSHITSLYNTGEMLLVMHYACRGRADVIVLTF